MVSVSGQGLETLSKLDKTDIRKVLNARMFLVLGSTRQQAKYDSATADSSTAAVCCST